MRAVFGDDEEAVSDRLRELLTKLTEAVNDDGRLRKLALARPALARTQPRLPRGDGAGRRGGAGRGPAAPRAKARTAARTSSRS